MAASLILGIPVSSTAVVQLFRAEFQKAFCSALLIRLELAEVEVDSARRARVAGHLGVRAGLAGSTRIGSASPGSAAISAGTALAGSATTALRDLGHELSAGCK
jgi:hypothetical protein